MTSPPTMFALTHTYRQSPQFDGRPSSTLTHDEHTYINDGVTSYVHYITQLVCNMTISINIIKTATAIEYKMII